MVQRADPAYLKRPKPFLQYIIIGKDTSYLSDLFFAQIDKPWLDPCSHTRFDEKSMEGLVERAQAFESQVLARCAGLVEIALYKRVLAFGMPRDNELAEVDRCANQVARISASVGDRPLSFIHRTAWDFLVDDPAGQTFIRACSTDEHEAIINLLRAKLARAKFRVDCPLAFWAVEDWSDETTREVKDLERKAEICQALDYHYLSLALQAEYFQAAGLTQKSTVQKVDRLARALNLDAWSPSLPFDLALSTSYACRHGLNTLIQSLIRSASLHNRRQIVASLWMDFCLHYPRTFPHDFWLLSSFWRDKSLATEMLSLSPLLLTEIRLADDGWDDTGFWSRPLPAPFWSVVLGLLLRSDQVDGADPNRREKAEKVAKMLHKLFQKADLSLLTELRVALGNEGWLTAQVMPKCWEINETRPPALHSGLMLCWTVGGILRCFMSETSIQELDLPMTGSRPRATHWRRANTEDWLDIETVATSELSACNLPSHNMPHYTAWGAASHALRDFNSRRYRFGRLKAEFMLWLTDDGVAKCYSSLELSDSDFEHPYDEDSDYSTLQP